MIDLLDGSEVEDGMRLTLVWWFAASFVDLVVLGATCTDRDCRKVATYDVAWPGGYGTLAYCTRHHDLLARIADAMGFELVYLRIKDTTYEAWLEHGPKGELDEVLEAARHDHVWDRLVEIYGKRPPT